MGQRTVGIVVLHSIMEKEEDNCFAWHARSRKQKAKYGPNLHTEKELREGTVVSSQGSHSAPSTKLTILK